MTQKPERPTDETGHFGAESSHRTHHEDHRPGVAKEERGEERGEGERPPVSREKLEEAPLRERFAREQR